VKIVSLDFGRIKMFDYAVAGFTESDTPMSKIERECERLD
jgi:hypothetical protein